MARTGSGTVRGMSWNSGGPPGTRDVPGVEFQDIPIHSRTCSGTRAGLQPRQRKVVVQFQYIPVHSIPFRLTLFLHVNSHILLSFELRREFIRRSTLCIFHESNASTKYPVLIVAELTLRLSKDRISGTDLVFLVISTTSSTASPPYIVDE